MLHRPELEIIAALVGLFAGSLVVYGSPRLVAYRLSDTPVLPSSRVLIPLAGLWQERWRLRSSLIVELSTAAALAGLASYYGSSAQLLIAGVYTVLFIAIAYIDIDYRLVLNRLSYPAAAFAIPSAIIWPGFGWRSCLMGAAVGGAIFLVLQLVGRGALGTGDTKLAIVIGAIRGFPTVFDALLYGMVLGGFGALIAWLVLRKGRKSYIAYAPYLAAGAIISFFSPM